MRHNILIVAKALNLRPKRVLDKVHNLTISVHYKDDVPYIDMDGLRTLTSKYVNSKRTSERTRQYARKLLAFLDEGNANLEQLHSAMQGEHGTEGKRKPKEKYRHSSSGTKSVSTNKHVNKVQEYLTVLSKSVQLILATCVHSLESLYFKFFALFVSIFVQMHHTAAWFYRTAPEESSSWLAAYGYAFMLDLFILVVTMEGRMSIAKTFAALTFISNLLYFQSWVGFDFSAMAYAKVLSCIIISATIAFILYSYTEIFVKYKRGL